MMNYTETRTDSTLQMIRNSAKDMKQHIITEELSCLLSLIVGLIDRLFDYTDN